MSGNQEIRSGFVMYEDGDVEDDSRWSLPLMLTSYDLKLLFNDVPYNFRAAVLYMSCWISCFEPALLWVWTKEMFSAGFRITSCPSYDGTKISISARC